MPLQRMDVNQKHRPKPGLEFAIKDLKEAGDKKCGVLGEGLATKWYHRIASLDIYKKACTDFLTKNFGKDLGPIRNASACLESEMRKAIDLQYPIEDGEVQIKFCYYLMAVVTEGFYDEDTTGTVVGNFKGEWRGGGF